MTPGKLEQLAEVSPMIPSFAAGLYFQRGNKENQGFPIKFIVLVNGLAMANI